MLSVIVPAHRADPALERCLDALRPTAAAGHAVIVVDDGSPGAGVSRRAETFGYRAIRHERSRGPAAARNSGAAEATTPVVLFVDSDIVVRPDTADLVCAWFDAHPDVAALFGSYDAAPDAPQFVSQFKNLTHHYGHQHSAVDASTFWAGCGAVRRDPFLALGGFDETFTRPCIEDIEFGYRLRRTGARIALVKALQVKHLKRWTLAQLVRTDVFDRGAPWMELILEQPSTAAADLNLSLRARLGLALTWLTLAALVAMYWWLPAGAFAVGGLALALLLEYGYFAWLAEQRGVWFAVRCVPLHLLYQLYAGVAGAIGLVRYALGPSRRRTVPRA